LIIKENRLVGFRQRDSLPQGEKSIRHSLCRLPFCHAAWNKRRYHRPGRHALSGCFPLWRARQFHKRSHIYSPAAIAIAAGLFLIIQALSFISAGFDAVTKRIAMALIAIVLAQVAFVAVNIYFLAPVWMQLVHLLLADLLWTALILMADLVFNSL
jgi:heme A synthase